MSDKIYEITQITIKVRVVVTFRGPEGMKLGWRHHVEGFLFIGLGDGYKGISMIIVYIVIFILQQK